MKSTGLILDMPLNLDTVELPTAYDMSREQAEGVVTNATLAADGKSIVLDGTAYVTVPDATQYDVKTALSAEAWIQKDDLVGNEIILGKWTNTGNQREWFITATEQKLQVNFGDPTNGTSEGSWATDNNVIVAINTWYHAAFTFNAGTLVVYVNGVSMPGAVTSGLVPVSFIMARLM